MKLCRRTAPIAGVILALLCSGSHAVTLPAGGSLSLDLSGNPNDDDDSGIVIRNTSDSAGQVEIEYLTGHVPAKPPGAFILLDGTMRVTVSDLDPKDYRLLLIREYDPQEARRNGLRGRELRLLRRRARPRGGIRWIRARPADAARRREGRIAAPYGEVRNGTKRVLGQYGYYPDDTYVWAVVDQASDFTAGGLPEPLTLTMLLAGAVAMLARRRKL